MLIAAASITEPEIAFAIAAVSVVNVYFTLPSASVLSAET
jgi:hypothetical protein